MAEITTKIVELIRPDSDTLIDYELYEYLLMWKDKSGVFVQWLFTDWQLKKSTEREPINISDPDKIQSLINDSTTVIQLVAEDIKRDEREMFEALFDSKKCFRLYRNDSENYTAGGYERLAILSNSMEWINSKQRFVVNVTVQKVKPYLYR